MATFIPEEIISEIRNAADVLEVISESVQLKKTGQNYVGLCPFHSEKTPSFSVSPEREIFHCFGCGEGGNVFSFVMKRDGVTFPEAARMLGQQYGVDIPERELGPAEKRKVSERESLLSINALAMKYFHNMLMTGKQGENARTYLTNRGIAGEIVTSFNLGFVPDGWDHLSKFLSSRKVPCGLAERSGLIVSKNKERYYDRFRNRVIFPIIDTRQQIIGFGGRVLDDSLPKYLNSPETPVYNKSKSLYGYNTTKQVCRETETVHIVEGYFDLLSLYSNGVKNAVATLGTAITKDHIRMLSRGGIKKFILVYDSDAAGIKAAERSIPIFQKEFINANILVLPQGYDPDSYIREFGKENFLKASGSASGVIRFLVESAINKHGLSIEGRINIINDMRGPLSMVDDAIARSLYLRDLAGRIGVDERAVLEKVKEYAAQKPRGNAGHIQKSTMAVALDRRNDSMPVKPAGKWAEMEKQIISMMLQFPEILPECRTQRVVDYFEDMELKAIGQQVMSYSGDYSLMVSDLMTQSQTGMGRQLIASLAIGDIPWLFKNCVSLINQFIDNRIRHADSLSERIRAAEEKNDQELLIKLINEKNEYSKSLKEKQVQTRKR